MTNLSLYRGNLAVASPGLAEQGKEVGHMVEYMVMQRKVEKI